MEYPTDRASGFSGGRKRRPNFIPNPETAADEVSISLHEWLALEEATSTREGSNLLQKEKSVLRKSQICYGIVEVFKAARSSALRSTPKDLQSSCVVENFTIFIRGDFLEDEDIGAIAGVRCETPPSRAKIITPNFGSSIFEQGPSSGEDGFLEVEVHPPPLTCLEVAEDRATSPDETRLRHLLGRLLHSIFLDGSPYVEGESDNVGSPESRLLSRGLPSSIHLLCRDLLKGELSIDEASTDLHYMIMEPSAFLRCSDMTPSNFSLIRSKLRGRDAEIRTMNDTFCKLTTTGVSEVMFVSGFSGSGKSRLVRTVVPHVAVAGGFAISKKFPQGIDDSLSLVLEAINDLIIMVSEDSTDEELYSIASELISSVGEVFLSVIHQVLPSIDLLFNVNVTSLASLGRGMPEQTSGLTNESISFILKTLITAISSRDRPVLLHFDDIQWTNASSLSVMAELVSGGMDTSCIFLVLGYRDNEINQAVLNDLTACLRRSCVPVQHIHLVGIDEPYFIDLISNALCMLPRHCKSLSTAVYRKTKGNPFFAFQMLGSLVDHRILSYNTSCKCWTWTDAIYNQDLSENVLFVLRDKFDLLDSETQHLLRVAASLRGSLPIAVATRLDLPIEKINSAISIGIMERCPGSDVESYQFTHDKFREAASADGETAFRYSLGMKLLDTSSGQKDEYFLDICDLINVGVEGNRVAHSDLNRTIAVNILAGDKAIQNSDFIRALGYCWTAKSLLPSDHWSSMYDPSLRLHLSLSKSLYANGQVDLAESTLRELIDNSRDPLDTLDAHHQLHFMLHQSNRRSEEAFQGCMRLLEQLGEDVPDNFEDTSAPPFARIRHVLEKKSEEEILAIQDLNDENDLRRIRFLSQACIISSTALRPRMTAYCIARMVEISLRGFSVYTPYAFVALGTLLCGQRINAISEAQRIGKIALRLFNERFSDPGQLPLFNLAYYGFVSVRFESFQTCATHLRQASTVAFSTGNFALAIINNQISINKFFFAGKPLPSISEDIKRQIELTVKYKDSRCVNYARFWNQTLQSLMHGEAGNSSLPEDRHLDGSLPADRHLDATASMMDTFHKAVQTFWKGHHKRFIFLMGQSTSNQQGNAMADIPKLMSIINNFYHSLVACALVKASSKVSEMRRVIAHVREDLKELASESPQNYENKKQLLEAEIYSCRNETHNGLLRKAYDASILSAKSSNFIHEQGLACELAGKHFLGAGKRDLARKYLEDAQKCYTEWGCTPKVHYVKDILSGMDD